MTKKSQTPNSNIDQIITRARAMKPAARGRFIASHSAAEIAEIYAALLGDAKPKTPRPVLERKVLAALAEPAPAAAAPQESNPLDEALASSETGAANAASWDGALPEPGYVPPAGTGDETPTARDEAPAEGEGAASAADTADASTGETGANDGGDAAGATGKPARKAAAPKEPPAPRERDPRLPAVGTVIVKKDRHGVERVRCTIVEGGVEYNGKVYKSLSGAGLQASKDLGNTTTTCDGLAFWGLKKATARTASTKDPVAGLQKAWDRYLERAAAAAKAAEGDDRSKVHGTINQHITALTAIAAQVA